MRVLGFYPRSLLRLLVSEAMIVGLIGGLVAVAGMYLMFCYGFQLTPGGSCHLPSSARSRSPPLWVWLATVIGVPLVLKSTGVFSHTVVIDHELMCLRSPIFASQGSDAYVFGWANIVLLIAVAAYGNNINGQMARVRHELKVHAWHLRHLLPGRVDASSRANV